MSPYEFKTIKDYYDEKRDSILAAPDRMRGCDVYDIDWPLMFSPIEALAWNEIRLIGLVMYPQYPVAEMFVDFASPRKKVVLECDGAAFHDKNQDRERDERMKSRGWTVYRIKGREFMRNTFCMDEFIFGYDQATYEDGYDDLGYSTQRFIQEQSQRLRESYCGVFLAIEHKHFGGGRLPACMSECLESIALDHMSIEGACNA